LIDEMHDWAGGDATLVCLGDYVDRGPEGMAVVARVMRLQAQAAAQGGQVIALIGNHDLVLTAAYRFPRSIFYDWWLSAGGVRRDLTEMTPAQLRWLVERPSMVLHGDRQFIHADAELYYAYGDTADEVNARLTQIIKGNDWQALDRLLEEFSEHRTFYRDSAAAARFLATYGGRQIVHGHTPLYKMSGQSPADVCAPYVYANGLCVNLDGGLYLGGVGFVYRLDR
jgi:hypothetical protein